MCFDDAPSARGVAREGRRSQPSNMPAKPFRATSERRSVSKSQPLQPLQNRANAGARRRAARKDVTRLPEDMIGVFLALLETPTQLSAAEGSCRFCATPIPRG